MEKIRIVGGKPLEGTVRISGAKNASLPDVCAAILTDQRLVLHNVPEVRDIRTMGRVLSAMGVQTDIKVGGVVELQAGRLPFHEPDLPEVLARNRDQIRYTLEADDLAEADAVFASRCDFDAWPPVPIRVAVPRALEIGVLQVIYGVQAVEVVF